MLDIGDITTLQMVRLDLNNARTSDQLLALSKAGDFNIFADATRFSSTSEPLSMNETQYFYHWVLETAEQEHLTWRRSRERTLLFWKQPDVLAAVKDLATEIEAQPPKQGAEATTTEVTTGERALKAILKTPLYKELPWQEAELYLADYLQEQKGWDGKSALELEFKLSEMPPQAAAELLRLAHTKTDDSTQKKQKFWSDETAWFSDQLWQNARLFYTVPPTRNKSGKTFLTVSITSGDTQNFAPLEGRFLMFPLEQQKSERVEVSMVTLPETVAKERDALPLLSAQALSNDKALTSAISLQFKEASFSELLSEMQKQSGVGFELSPALGDTRRVTVRTAALPVRDVMDALSELYGVGWAKTPIGAYQMQSKLSPARVRALQIGNSAWFDYWHSYAVRKAAPARLKVHDPIDWPSVLRNAGIDESSLRAPNGVAVAELPTELQTLIRAAVEQGTAMDLMRQYYEAFPDSAVLTEASPNAITVSVSPMQQPKLPPVRRGSRPPVNNSPLLKVALLENGAEVYSYFIGGLQAREVLMQTVRTNKDHLVGMKESIAQEQ